MLAKRLLRLDVCRFCLSHHNQLPYTSSGVSETPVVLQRSFRHVSLSNTVSSGPGRSRGFSLLYSFHTQFCPGPPWPSSPGSAISSTHSSLSLQLSCKNTGIIHVHYRRGCPKMSSNKARRIAKEIADIRADMSSHVQAEPVGEDLMKLRGTFDGPPGTAYEGGIFNINIDIPNEYPFRPPIMKFATKVWHPNVSSQTVGEATSYRQATIPAGLTSTGCHLPRYSFHRLVTCSHNQISFAFPPVTPQYPGAERSARRRGSSNDDQKSQGIRASGSRVVGEIRRCAKEKHWGKQWWSDSSVDRGRREGEREPRAGSQHGRVRRLQ